MKLATIVAVWMVAMSASGCLSEPVVRLEVGDLWYAQAADPRGGMVMLFNFTLYNNGTADASDITISIDGLNRTPAETNHYGRAERSLQGLPAGQSFVIQGRLDIYNTCHLHDPEYSECASGDTYFTIRARAANGPETVKIVRDDSTY